MENKRDLRYEKADKKIKTEFVKLLKTKGYQKITVSQIIKVANVNRSTFYNHYLDKADLMEKLEIELIKKITDNKVIDIDDLAALEMRIDQLIIGIYNNKDEVKLYLSEQSDGLFFKRYSDFLEQLIIKSGASKLLKIPSKYALASIESVVVNILVTWINQEFPETPSEIGNIISKIIPDLFKSMTK